MSKVIYLGNLRTEATHLKSGNKIVTDAPVDNQGRGEAFSPTDLMSTSLATCMLTVMGIAAKGHGINIDGTSADVTKVMESNPRRVSEIHTEITFPPNQYSAEEKKLLEHAAVTCPVMLSIHPDIIHPVTFIYNK